MASNVIKPEEYLTMGIPAAYTVLGLLSVPTYKEVPDIFSCNLEGDHLVLKTGFSSYKFPSGNTFHDVLSDRSYEVIKKMGAGLSNKTELIEIEGTKYLLRQPIHMSGGTSKFIREGYFRECIHLSILSPSPYVMKLFAAEGSPDRCAMLLEYVEGTTLTNFLETKPSVEEKERIKAELVKGLQHLHSKYIAHYDIKPDNIFVPSNKSRPPFFIDFGSSGRYKNENNLKIYKNDNTNKLNKIFGSGRKNKYSKRVKRTKFRRTKKNYK
uniref:Protein kinase domain-containing protein n=1 Tax=viral metagenome TaxID=1070528 RepID=A0A6C0DUM1_9ZZZZ